MKKRILAAVLAAVVSLGLVSAAEANQHDVSVSRAEFVGTLHGLLMLSTDGGTSQFSDVTSGTSFLSAIVWAERVGVVDGMGDGSFAPDEPITREQAATIMFDYLQFVGFGQDSRPVPWFIDMNQVADWAVDGVMFVGLNNLMDTIGSPRFDPQGLVTQAEMDEWIPRLLTFAGT